jgi:hypothetical protein
MWFIFAIYSFAGSNYYFYNNVIRLLIILFLLLSFVIKSQDEIITKQYQYDPDPNLVITGVVMDTIYYNAYNKSQKILLQDIVAIRENYKQKGSTYNYIKPNYERIYGIRAGNAFFKADYRFSTDIPKELAKLYLMEKFRLYESIPDENVTRPVYLINKETGEKVKLPNIKGFYIYVKNDQLHREIKAKIHFTTTDSTQLIVRAAISGDTHIYSINEEDIEAIGIQSDGALAGRVAMGIISRGASWQFYENKWLTKYDFTVWRLGS